MKKIILFLLLASSVFANEYLLGKMLDNQTNGRHKNILVDVSGNTAEVHYGSVHVIDFVHEKVHDGKTYRFCTTNIGVANNSYMRVAYTPSVNIHWVGYVNAEGKAYVKLYEGSVVTGGVRYTPQNMNRTYANASQTIVSINPTVVTLGTELSTWLLTGGTGPQSIGSDIRQNTEIVLSGNVTYMIEAQNVSGQSKDFNINAQWYREQ